MFTDFDALSKTLTIDYYRAVLGFAVFMTPKEYPQNVFGLAIEFFKVQNGLIQAIDAFSRTSLQEQHSGWGSGPGS